MQTRQSAGGRQTPTLKADETAVYSDDLHIDRILCIRMLRLPPQQIALNVPFDIMVSITDDVGTQIPDYGQILCKSSKQEVRHEHADTLSILQYLLIA